MPVVGGTAARGHRPLITLLARPTEARAEALMARGRETKMVSVEALIDTGASDTFIERSLADELELDPIGEKDIYGVTAGDHPESGFEYLIRVIHAGVPAVDLAGSVRVVAIADLSRFGTRMLLGRDLLARGVMVYDGLNARFSFAF